MSNVFLSNVIMHYLDAWRTFKKAVSQLSLLISTKRPSILLKLVIRHTQAYIFENIHEPPWQGYDYGINVVNYYNKTRTKVRLNI